MATVAEVQMVQPVVELIKVGVLPFIRVVLVQQDIYSKVDEDDEPLIFRRVELNFTLHSYRLQHSTSCY